MTLASAEEVEAVRVELNRVVDRLNSIPLGRVASATSECRDAAAYIVERTREFARDIPVDAVLPHLRPQGLGSMLKVVGRDYLDAVAGAPATDVTPVLEHLTDLRRSLP